MSTEPSTSTSRPDFVFIFNAALEAYKRRTKIDLASHPLLPILQVCDSAEAVLAVLQERIPAFSQSQNGGDGLTNWVFPTVNVLYSVSRTLGQGVGLVNVQMLPEEFSVLISTFRRFHRRMQFLWESAFFSWSASFIFPCAAYFDTQAPRRL